MNVLITGAAGFLGRQLVKALQKKNKTSPEKDHNHRDRY